MALVDNFAKVAGTLLAIAKTRAELIAIELEEEWVRLLSYLLLSLSALFCLALTVFLAVILVIVLCWDSCRIPGSVRRSFRRKPRLLELTRQEIAKDIDRLTPSA